MGDMDHISEAFKQRNIILETNDPVVADGFTQVPNFILKIHYRTVFLSRYEPVG
jgi:hypothetical protein